jgi:hypothetical protein
MSRRSRELQPNIGEQVHGRVDVAGGAVEASEPIRYPTRSGE